MQDTDPHVVISADKFLQLEQWLRFKPGDFPIKNPASIDRYVAAILNARRILGMPNKIPTDIIDANTNA